MASRREELQTLLSSISGVAKAYFQPPANLQLDYPCIIYKRVSEDVKFADDTSYLKTKRYRVTVIDQDPDSSIPDAVGGLPLCVFETHYVSDNLNHDVYNLYY